MSRRTLIVVPLAALAAIVITAATGGGSSAHLPLPQRVPFSAAHKTTAGKPTQAGNGNGSTTPAYAIPTPVPLTGCSVSVSNPSPLKGQTAETATVTTAPGAHVRLDAYYPRAKSTHGGLASSSGTIAFPLPITHVLPGFTVQVVATASLLGIQRTCSSSFTPV